MVKIAPSILAANYLQIQKCLDAVKDADMLHLDIMDGHFVPNISMGPEFVRACKNGSLLPCEVHLMIEEPLNLLDLFIDAGSDIITLHVESTSHIYKGIQMLKEANVGVGIALNPGTPLSLLEPFIEEIDLLLIMTVNPGFGGQNFIQGMLKKITQARAMITNVGKEIALAVDGGVKEENVLQIIEAGANVLVAGSAIFHGDIADGWKSFAKLTRG